VRIQHKIAEAVICEFYVILARAQHTYPFKFFPITAPTVIIIVKVGVHNASSGGRANKKPNYYSEEILQQYEIDKSTQNEGTCPFGYNTPSIYSTDMIVTLFLSLS